MRNLQELCESDKMCITSKDRSETMYIHASHLHEISAALASGRAEPFTEAATAKADATTAR